jgi:hypothetical protein
MPPETEEQRRLREAEERGQFREKLAQHFHEDDRRFRELGAAVGETKQATQETGKEVRGLVERLDKREALVSGAAEATAALAEKSLSRREFMVGLMASVAAVGLLITGVLALFAH